jgi:hypothetical protein
MMLYRKLDCLRVTMGAMMLGLAVGCSSVQTPTAQVRGARLGDVTAEGLTLSLDTLVTNPNPVPIPLAKTSYNISMAGQDVASGTVNPAAYGASSSSAGGSSTAPPSNASPASALGLGTLPANGSRALTLPIQIKWDDLMKAESAVVQTGGDVPYNLTGKLGFSPGSAAGLGSLGGLGEQSIPVSYSGTLPLRQALQDPAAFANSPVARTLAQRLLSSKSPIPNFRW